jgi:hypothetical protein
MGGCQVAPLKRTRGTACEASVKRARTTGRPSTSTDHDVRSRTVPRSLVRRKSASSFGIAHSPRPPATEAGESTQMSVIDTALTGAFTTRATSSSE